MIASCERAIWLSDDSKLFRLLFKVEIDIGDESISLDVLRLNTDAAFAKPPLSTFISSSFLTYLSFVANGLDFILFLLTVKFSFG